MTTNDRHARPPPPFFTEPGALYAYETDKLLGTGGFGVCYGAKMKKGISAVISKPVALKIVKTDMPTKVREKFLTELQIHAKMRHENIARFHRAFTLGESTYLVLEVCTNGSLKDMLKARRTLSLPEVRRFGLQICGALNYMHERSVIHRDLKTANIFLNETMDVKIGDFGLSAVLLDSDEMGTHRRTTFCGTPNYLAPEVISKEGHDCKADMWSFGVLLYFMLVGSPPFQKAGDHNQGAVFTRVTNNEWQWPADVEDTIPSPARKVVEDLLTPSAEIRPGPRALASYPFFEMKGGIPAAIEQECRTKIPQWLDRKKPREMRARAAKVSLEDMIKKCGLEASSASIPSIYHEFLVEEKLKRTPRIPLEAVYEPMKVDTAPLRRNGTLKRMQAAQEPKMIEEQAISSADTSKSTTSMISSHDDPTNINLKHNNHLDDLILNLSAALRGKKPISSNLPLPPKVVRWCNYSIKYGIGYILSTGAIGVVFTRPQPIGSIVVPNVLTHLRDRQNPGYADRDQIISPTSPDAVEFYERNHKNDLTRVLVPASTYHRKTGSSKGYTTPAHNAYDIEKGNRLELWFSFAKYMVDRLGAKNEHPTDDDLHISSPSLTTASPSPSAPSSTQTAHPIVTKYQRIGNVGVWIFSTGALQFDFPDRTKLLLSADGADCELYHLPLVTAEALHAGEVPPHQLDPRKRLAMPLHVMLSANGDVNEVLKELMDANEVREKVGFMRDVAVMWKKAGGVGGQTRGEKFAWNGVKWPMGGAKEEMLGWTTVEL